MKDKIAGKVEELKGRITGDPGTEMKGKGRQVVGEAKRVGKEVAYDAEHPAPPEQEQDRPASPPPER